MLKKIKMKNVICSAIAVLSILSAAGCSTVAKQNLATPPADAAAPGPMQRPGPLMSVPPMPQNNAVISRPIQGPGPVIIPPMQPMMSYASMPQNLLLLNKHSRPVSYGQVTLMGLNLNNSGNRISVNPGAIIPAVAAYIYNCPDCKPDSINQIIVGIAGTGAQSCLYNGGTQGQNIAYFNLIAPQKPGEYDIRFRYAQAFGCEDALKNWWDVHHSPALESTVGKIIVR